MEFSLETFTTLEITIIALDSNMPRRYPTLAQSGGRFAWYRIRESTRLMSTSISHTDGENCK